MSTETPPVEPTTPPVEPPTPPAQETDWKAEARKWEQRAKSNLTEAENLRKAVEDSKKSAEQKAADDLKAAQEAANAAAAKALRYEIAASKGLDLSLAARLTGSTKEELEADADTLMALIPKTPQTPPAGPPVTTTPGATPTAALITDSDLEALAKAGKYEEINRLRREGRLNHLLAKS